MWTYALLMAVAGGPVTSAEFADQSACEEAGRQLAAEMESKGIGKLAWVCQPKGTLTPGSPEAIAHEKALLAREKTRAR